MSLYLVVFDNDGAELEGWVLGHYSDFGCYRDTIAAHVDPSAFPTLLNHSDCDGEWPVCDLSRLKRELQCIAMVLKKLPPEETEGAFEHVAEARASAQSLYGCFHNIDGENLTEALIRLCDVGLQSSQPICFQ